MRSEELGMELGTEDQVAFSKLHANRSKAKSELVRNLRDGPPCGRCHPRAPAPHASCRETWPVLRDPPSQQPCLPHHPLAQATGHSLGVLTVHHAPILDPVGHRP